MMWIANYVPPWIWVILIVAATGALWFYFSPILTLVWNWLPTPVKILLAAVLSIVLAVLYGRYKGAKDERDLQKKRDAEAVQTRRTIDADIHDDTDADLDKRASRWMRD